MSTINGVFIRDAPELSFWFRPEPELDDFGSGRNRNQSRNRNQWI